MYNSGTMRKILKHFVFNEDIIQAGAIKVLSVERILRTRPRRQEQEVAYRIDSNRIATNRLHATHSGNLY